MRGLIVASLWLALAVNVTHGSPVGSCSTFSGTGAITFLRDDSNCSVYYECVTMAPTMMMCPNSLHFNMVLKVCDWPSASGCAAAATSPSPVMTKVFTRPAVNPMVHKPTPSPELESANVRTVRFTREAASTEAAPVPLRPIQVQPNEPTECPSVGSCPEYKGDDSILIQLPHAFNCSRFCKCDHGVPVTFECPGGLQYNKLAGYCDWPANAKCLPDRGFAAVWSPPHDPSAHPEPFSQGRAWNLRHH